MPFDVHVQSLNWMPEIWRFWEIFYFFNEKFTFQKNSNRAFICVALGKSLPLDLKISIICKIRSWTRWSSKTSSAKMLWLYKKITHLQG